MTKTDYDTKSNETEKKVSDHNHEKYITTLEFNNLGTGVCNARLARENLVIKTDFDTKLKEINKKINSSKTKYLLVENELRNKKNLTQPIFETNIFLIVMALKIK